MRFFFLQNCNPMFVVIITINNNNNNNELLGVMGPTTFREQLRTIFGLRLTRAELGGLVSAFDLHRDGMIDAKEFAFRCARCAQLPTRSRLLLLFNIIPPKDSTSRGPEPILLFQQ